MKKMSDVGFLLNDEKYYDDSDSELLREDNSASENKYTILKIVFFILCFLLVGELVAYKLVLPAMGSPKVTVSGQKNYSANEIALKLLEMDTSSWIKFDVQKAASILSSIAGIEEVKIEKKFPDKVFINIKERTPVAVTFLIEDGHSIPVQIDSNGVLFFSEKKNVFDTASVPIISGLPVVNVSDGMRIPSAYRPLIEAIAEIEKLPQKYFAAISEICVIPKEFGNYELSIIPSLSKVKVLTDRALNEEALKYMMVVLDVVNQLDSEVSLVDLRYGSVAYRVK